MITFFRKMRQNLLNKDQKETSISPIVKYFLYTIGEILLVMIGILLALQVNNWNEDRKADALQEQYLQRLIIDLEKDLIFLENEVKVIEERNQSILDFTTVLKNEDSSSEQMLMTAERFFESGWFVPIFSPAQSTFDDLTSTGQLNIIKNVKLRDQLTALYKEYEGVKAGFKMNNEWLNAIDIKITSETDALQYDPRTKKHFEKIESIEDLKINKSIYQRSAASHDWANQSALRDFKKLNQLVKGVLDDLRSNVTILNKN